MEFADLAIIDLSKAATPEGRAELALQTREALASVGFFYVINHGYTPAQVRSQNLESILRGVDNDLLPCPWPRPSISLTSRMFLSLKSLLKKKRSTLDNLKIRQCTEVIS